MNELTLQLMGLQYELAMNMSSTLELGGMLRSVLETLLRQLDARKAAVFRRGRDDDQPRLCEALPRGFHASDDLLDEVRALSSSESRTSPHIRRLPDGSHRYVFALIDFGALLLERVGPALDPRILGALAPVMDRLGRAALACETHVEVETAHRRFDTLVATVPDVVIYEARLDAHGGLSFDFVSPRARDVLGVGADELVRRPESFTERIHEDDRDVFAQTLENAARQTTAFERRLRVSTGGLDPRWVLVAASPRPEANGSTRWSGFIQDVSAHELLLAARQAVANAQLTSLMEVIGDAVIGADAAGRITHWNRAAERILGYSQQRALGAHISLALPQSLLETAALSPDSHVSRGQPEVVGRLVELSARHADGRDVPVELLLNRIDVEGATCFFGVLRDLTHRKETDRVKADAAAEEQRLTSALLEVGRFLTESRDLPTARVTELVVDTLGVDRASIWSSRADGIDCRDLFDSEGRVHSSGAELSGAQYEPYLAGLREGRLIDATDAATHPVTACFRTTYLEPLGIVSMLDVPLLADEVLGVLCIESRVRREWSPPEVRFSVDLGNLVSRAFERDARARADARYEAILSSVGDAVIACDLDGKITLLNPMAALLTGWSTQEALGRPLDDVFTVQSSHLSAEGPTRSTPVRPGQPSVTDVRPSLLVRRDGQTIPISQSASPIMQGAEQTGVVLTFRDVSAEEASRDALEQQFLQLQSIGAAIPDLVFTVRTDGTIRYVQQRPSEDLLVPSERVDGLTIQDVFAGEQTHLLLDAVRQVAATNETKTIDYQLDLPRGRQHFEARMARIGDDEVTAIVRNVTLDRERDALLAQERERLQTVLGSASVILYVARLPDFALEYTSESVQSVLGYSPEDFIRPGFWETLIHPGDRARLEVALQKLPPAGGQTSYEFRHLHADGTYHWMRDEIRVVAGANGGPDQAIGASYDITERKRAERRLSSSLSLQRNVSEISTVLLGADLRGIDRLVELALGRVARFANAERAYVFLAEGELMFNTHEWCADGIEPQKENLQGIPFAEWRYFMKPLEDGRALIIPSVRGLPPEAAVEREALSAQNIETLIAVPLTYRDDLRGFVGIDNPEVEDPEELEDLALPMRIFAEVVAGGIERAADEKALRDLNERVQERVARQRALLSLSSVLPNARTREDLYAALGAHFATILGSARVSLVTRIAAEGKIQVRLLDIDPKIEQRANDEWIRMASPERVIELSEIVDTAVFRVLETGRLLTTADTELATYHDWIHLQQHYGLQHFVMVPWSGPRGVFGCFNVAYAREAPLTREDVEWVEQVGALIGAHVAAHEAREALERMNLDLEARVEERTLALRSSEERFQELFRQAPQAMLLVDSEGNVVRINLRARALFGLDLTSEAGLSLDKLIPDSDRARHGGLMRSFFGEQTSRSMGFNRPLPARRVDGSTFFAEIGLVTLLLGGEAYVVAGVTDVTERIEARDAVLQSLREKETMLQEIHHRVKNNLQIISSILMLQSEQISSPEAQAPLKESVMRVRSMALIHQQLYGVDSLDRVELGEYARALSESLRNVLMPSAKLCVHATPAPVTINDAVPLGLILNELITNAFKYGATRRVDAASDPDGVEVGSCDVKVHIDLIDGTLHMAVIDAGPGLPEDFDLERATSLGLHLVRALTRQLRGKFSYDRERGSRFSLTCPISSVS